MLTLHIILGVTLLLLLMLIISIISRLNLLARQIDSIQIMLDEADEKLDHAAQIVLGNHIADNAEDDQQ